MFTTLVIPKKNDPNQLGKVVDQPKLFEIFMEFKEWVQIIGVPHVGQLNEMTLNGQIGEIIRFALERTPTVRGVHFQPISYFGRYPQSPKDQDRITIPELIRAIELQTNGKISSASLRPPRAENAYCSFQGNYVLMPDGELKTWKQKEAQGCCGPLPAADGANRAREFVAKKWAAPLIADAAGNEKGAACCVGNTDSLDEFLDRVKRFSFCISGMGLRGDSIMPLVHSVSGKHFRMNGAKRSRRASASAMSASDKRKKKLIDEATKDA